MTDGFSTLKNIISVPCVGWLQKKPFVGEAWRREKKGKEKECNEDMTEGRLFIECQQKFSFSLQGLYVYAEQLGSKLVKSVELVVFSHWFFPCSPNSVFPFLLSKLKLFICDSVAWTGTSIQARHSKHWGRIANLGNTRVPVVHACCTLHVTSCKTLCY